MHAYIYKELFFNFVMWFKRFLIKRALNKANSKSSLEQVADETLKEALKELQQTSKTANKILQAKLIRQENNHALKQIYALDDELDDEEEEEREAPETMQDKIANMLLNKFMGGGSNQTETHEELKGVNMGQISEIAKSLSPAQIEELKKKFLG